MRTQTAPGVWRDDGPSRASIYVVGYVARPALTVGSMVPILTGQLIVTRYQGAMA